MRLKWDFHELYDFGERISNLDKFEDACKKATKEMAKIFHEMLIRKTPVKTGTLQSFWQTEQNYSYTVIQMKSGFKVELVNEAVYARSVNDGHYSYNQYNVGGDPYVVRNRTVPYTQGNNDATFVFGHFFVEKSIAELENSDALEKVLYKELKKWFRWCVNGK